MLYVVSLQHPLIEFFVPNNFLVDLGAYPFLKPLLNWTPGL
jgi:hypothetical protein